MYVTVCSPLEHFKTINIVIEVYTRLIEDKKFISRLSYVGMLQPKAILSCIVIGGETFFVMTVYLVDKVVIKMCTSLPAYESYCINIDFGEKRKL